MEGCPEPLEKIFQKVEEESERRAQEEQRQNALNGDNNSQYMDDDEPTALAGTIPRAKSRKRRGSVSISRIGILPIEDLVSSKTQLPSPSSPSHLTMAVRSPFYQAQLMNSSTTSVASGASAHSQSDAHTEDDNHVTQMHHIIPKPSIGSKIMPRRLSRAHSASVMPTSNLGLGGGDTATLVIGVSVQEDRVESVLEEGEQEGGVNISRRASVSANGNVGVGVGVRRPGEGGLKKQASRSTLSGVGLGMGGSKKSLPSVGEESARASPGANTGGSTGGWLKKAKDLTMKFKRKASIMRPSRVPARTSTATAA